MKTAKELRAISDNAAQLQAIQKLVETAAEEGKYEADYFESISREVRNILREKYGYEVNDMTSKFSFCRTHYIISWGRTDNLGCMYIK